MHSMQLLFYSVLAFLYCAHSKINVTAKLQIHLKINAIRSLRTLLISLNFTGIFIHSVVIDYDTRLFFILSKLCCPFRFIYDFFFFFLKKIGLYETNWCCNLNFVSVNLCETRFYFLSVFVLPPVSAIKRILKSLSYWKRVLVAE